MGKFIDTLKSIIENFAKQTTLNVLAFTGSFITSVIYITMHSMTVLYIDIGFTVFLITNLSVKYIPILHNKYIDKKHMKLINTQKGQEKILSELDEYELQIISDLYYVYPNTLPFDIASASIMRLSENGMIVKSPYTLPNDMWNINGKMNWNYILQPFMKKALDNNPRFLKKKRKRQ